MSGFTKDLKTARRPINALVETVGTSGMFWGMLAKRRAIVSADLFCEWRAQAGGKQPFAIAWVDGGLGICRALGGLEGVGV